MTIKAVYASQSLSIYVTGGALDDLLTGRLLFVPLYFERDLKTYHGARLELTVDGLALLNYVVNAEREELDKGRKLNIPPAIDDRWTNLRKRSKYA